MQRDDTGLTYLRARYYNPGIGRFVSADPFPGFAGSPQSLNRYAYAGNNPVTRSDPTGMAYGIANALDMNEIYGGADLGGGAGGAGIAIAVGAAAVLITGAINAATDAVARMFDGGEAADNVEGGDERDIKGSGGAAAALGVSKKALEGAIEDLKQDNGIGGKRSNPDVGVDIGTGDVYPELPGGGYAEDSWGNIHDYLP